MQGKILAIVGICVVVVAVLYAMGRAADGKTEGKPGGSDAQR